MTDVLTRAALFLAGSIELLVVVKATAVVVLALVTARLARASRASVRGVLLTATFAVLLALPIAAVLVPPVAFEFPVAHVSDSAWPRTPVPLADIGLSLDETGRVVRRPAPPKPVAASTAVPALIRAAWALGAALFLAPVALTLWRLRRMRRCGLPWAKGQALIRTLAVDADIRRRVDILLHEDLMAPMTWGLLHPAIVLPSDAQAWSDADLEQAIVHELEHVRRGDWPIHVAARVVCALYWFHPIVWTAWRALCLESERACDDAVLRRAEGTAYAEQLVTLARRLSDSGSRPVLAMANRSDLFTRVSAVLDGTQQRGRAGAWYATAVAAGAIALVLGLSPLRAAPEPAVRIQGQPPASDAGPAFEVASVKPNKSTGGRGGRGGGGGGQNGLFTVTNSPLRFIIRNAYELQDAQLIGGPDWVAADRFDIQAKAPGNPPYTPEQLRLMIQRLLAERFKLAVHKETRQLPIYALILARSDGRLGPGLTVTDETTCQPPGTAAPMPPSSDPTQRQTPPCGALMFGPGQLVARGIEMARLGAMFTNVPAVTGLDRMVIDRTGLTAKYDFELKFLPVVPPPQPGDDRPSVFTALQEQLGLKLEPQRAPIEVLVIDHVEQPSED